MDFDGSLGKSANWRWAFFPWEWWTCTLPRGVGSECFAMLDSWISLATLLAYSKQ